MNTLIVSNTVLALINLLMMVFLNAMVRRFRKEVDDLKSHLGFVLDGVNDNDKEVRGLKDDCE